MRLKTTASLQLLRALRRPPFALTWQPARRLQFAAAAPPPDPPPNARASVWAAPEFRVADELDLHPDLLVVDFELASIGLVHVVDPSSKETVGDQAKRHVDQASYLRHLLITHGVSAGTERFPMVYTVECVLVVPEKRMHDMIAVVREIAANTRFLHATGLNLLKFATPVDAAELRRAFAWLLAAARERLSRSRAPAARLERLELLDYRLPGRRVWNLGSNRVHLLHGANGTGKSSIAEALELVVTGSVERIAINARADYAKVVANSDGGGAAEIKVSLSDGNKPQFKVVARGLDRDALDANLPVTAFRLDQSVMDQLVRTNSQQRARILTRSFFPGPAYRDFESAQGQFNPAFRELPLELRNEIARLNPDPNEWAGLAVSRLEWIEAPTISAERIADCLPLEHAHLEALGRIAPGITSSLQALASETDRATVETNLKLLDEALGRIRADARGYRDAVVQSLDVLPRLDAWVPEQDTARFEYPDLLRRWTEKAALSDLMKKHLEISRSLLDARTAGWQPGPDESAGLMAEPVGTLTGTIDRLTAAAKRCSDDERDLFKQFRSSSSAASPEATVRPTSALSDGEIAALNLVGTWLARQEATPPEAPFGTTIGKALSERTSEVFGTITIGGEGWTRRPVEFLAPLAAALGALLAFEAPAAGDRRAGETPGSGEPAIYRSPLARLRAYDTALTSARRLVAAYREVETTLMRRLTEQGLKEALDEVITLFTPARWAYEGLLLNANVQDGTVVVDFVTGKTGSAADTRLNTAELNVVVLALYLLCAPTIENPLGTIVLDDPLQNMDELTSATVARGMTKVASLLGDSCQLVMMFHSDEDLATFRREVPANVYYLPWLGPSGGVNRPENNVKRDTQWRPALAGEQRLDQVLRPHERTRRTRGAARKPRARASKRVRQPG